MNVRLLVVFGAVVVGCSASASNAGPSGDSANGKNGPDRGTLADGAADEDATLPDGGRTPNESDATVGVVGDAHDSIDGQGDGQGPTAADGAPLPTSTFDAGNLPVAPCGGSVHCVHPGESIQAAITAAGDGDTVQVAGGTFSQNVSVNLKSLTLLGGCNATFTGRDIVANETRIVGDGTNSVVTITADGKTVRIDGFTITGGTGNPANGYSGAGIWSQNGTVTIANNHITLNKVAAANINMTDTRGGGIEANGYGATNVSILGNVIDENASGRGAGIASSGVTTLLLEGNVIRNNRGYSDHGGGLFIDSPNVTIRGNRVEGNEIGPLVNPYGWGGGIFLNQLGTMAHLSYNVVTGNKAPSDGSGIFFNNGAKGTLDHELYYANVCPDTTSAAILVEATDPNTPGTITVSYSTVADHPCTNMLDGNAITLGSKGCRADVTRSIFWNNGANQFLNAQGADMPPTVTDSWTMDPQFVDSVNHDYHLKAGSPATGYGVY